jgi:hypothetical protein
MARYIEVTRSNNYCGCDSWEYYIFPDTATDEEINEYVADGMYDYAETYEYVATGGWDCDWESEEEREEYYNECFYNWRELTEQEEIDEHNWEDY